MKLFSERLISAYIINLQHRSDRRDNISNNLNEFGYELSNFHILEAIQDTYFGGLGCAKSHLFAISHFIANSTNEYCCILEDDFIFNIDQKKLDDTIFELTSKYEWDVYLLAGAHVVPFNLGDTSLNKVFESQTASGYIFKRHYAHKLLATFMYSITGMEKYRNINPKELIYNRFAIDQCWKTIQRQDQWYCTIPMAGRQFESYSDIENKITDYKNFSK